MGTREGLEPSALSQVNQLVCNDRKPRFGAVELAVGLEQIPPDLCPVRPRDSVTLVFVQIGAQVCGVRLTYQVLIQRLAVDDLGFYFACKLLGFEYRGRAIRADDRGESLVDSFNWPVTLEGDLGRRRQSAALVIGPPGLVAGPAFEFEVT